MCRKMVEAGSLMRLCVVNDTVVYDGRRDCVWWTMRIQADTSWDNLGQSIEATAAAAVAAVAVAPASKQVRWMEQRVGSRGQRAYTLRRGKVEGGRGGSEKDRRGEI